PVPREKVPVRRFLVNVNIVLDVALRRAPHVAPSTAFWSAVETGRTVGMLSAHAFPTAYYVARRHLGAVRANQLIGDLMTVFRVAPVDESVLTRALALGLSDFED